MSSIERWRLRNGRSANERVQAKPGRVALASGWMRFVIPPNGRISELSNRTARARAAHAGKDWEVPEGISRAAEKAREYASNVGKTLSETARSTASGAGEYAEASTPDDHGLSWTDGGANAEYRSGTASPGCDGWVGRRGSRCSCFPNYPNGARNSWPRGKTAFGSRDKRR
jgi:hypothetical protein